MASINSMSGSGSASSIYGNRNILSGLASGMDTESMIENAVSGIKTKISQLQQKRNKVEWQQEAYRSIIDKVSNFNTKYTSYTSSTNLFSASFFNSAAKVTSQGTYADQVTATGKTGSDVKILGVKQLATAATYTVSGLGGASGSGAITGGQVNLSDPRAQSNVSGTLTISYGSGRQFELNFDELTTYESVDKLAEGIRKKLDEIQVTNSSGEIKKASDMVDVKVENGNIVFSDKQNAGNTVTISAASGKIKDTLGIDVGAKSSTLSVSGKELVSKNGTTGEYLSGKELSVTLDGVTKKITLPTYQSGQTGQKFLEGLQAELDKAFGSGKITVDTTSGAADSSFSLKLTPQRGSTLSLSGDAATALGLSEGGSATYLDTGKKLGELLGSGFTWEAGDRVKAVGDAKEVKNSDGSSYFVDTKGNRVAKEGDAWYQTDNNGKVLYDFQVNGVSVGKFNEDTSLESVMVAMNNNAEAGVSVSYSKTTGQFQFTARETGGASKIEFGGLANKLFGNTASNGTYQQGKDAVLSMSVNGQVFDGITRSGNTFDVDGLSVTLKGTFGEYVNKDVDGNGTVDAKEYGLKDVDSAKADAVSFTTSSDTDKIVNAVKSMVEDYNAMVKEIKNAYSTMPATKANGNRYEPLTEEDRADMTDSAIKTYEEKAKQGILFMDSNLSSLYNQLRSAITPVGADGAYLRSIGISTSYSNGLTTLELDESKLRTALESDADGVRDAFTKTQENGASSNGLMQSLLTPLNTYGKTTGEPKGILVTRAGSPKAPTTINSNTLQSQINSIDDQIERWQTKLSDQVDRYTSKFTALEKLISEMNSQSSALAGLMGGGY